MIQSKLMRYAYFGALEAWEKEKARLEKNPASEIERYREQKRWNDLKEIERLYKEAEDIEQEMRDAK